MVGLGAQVKLLQGHSTPTGLSDVCHLQLSRVPVIKPGRRLPAVAGEALLTYADVVRDHAEVDALLPGVNRTQHALTSPWHSILNLPPSAGLEGRRGTFAYSKKPAQRLLVARRLLLRSGGSCWREPQCLLPPWQHGRRQDTAHVRRRHDVGAALQGPRRRPPDPEHDAVRYKAFQEKWNEKSPSFQALTMPKSWETVIFAELRSAMWPKARYTRPPAATVICGMGLNFGDWINWVR